MTFYVIECYEEMETKTRKKMIEERGIVQPRGLLPSLKKQPVLMWTREQ